MTSFRHHFLVSAPHYSVGELERVVVYICEHARKGAIGTVVNKVHHRQFHDLLKKENTQVSLSEQIPLYYGGPLSPIETMMVFHRKSIGSYRQTTQLGSDLFLTTSPDLLSSLSWRSQEDFTVVFGFMQWLPGQLEEEVLNDRWFMLDFEDTLLLQKRTVGDEFWQDCYKKLGFSPLQVVAPENIYQ